MYLNAFVGFLFLHPREKFLKLGVVFELFQGVELLGEVFVVEESVNLAVTSGTNVDRRAGIFVFSLGVLFGDEVMGG